MFESILKCTEHMYMNPDLNFAYPFEIIQQGSSAPVICLLINELHQSLTDFMILKTFLGTLIKLLPTQKLGASSVMSQGCPSKKISESFPEVCKFEYYIIQIQIIMLCQTIMYTSALVKYKITGFQLQSDIQPQFRA